MRHSDARTAARASAMQQGYIYTLSQSLMFKHPFTLYKTGGIVYRRR